MREPLKTMHPLNHLKTRHNIVSDFFSRTFLRALSICLNWPARLVILRTEFLKLKAWFICTSSSNFFKMTLTFLWWCNFEECVDPNLKNRTLHKQTDCSRQPVLANGKHPENHFGEESPGLNIIITITIRHHDHWHEWSTNNHEVSLISTCNSWT